MSNMKKEMSKREMLKHGNTVAMVCPECESLRIRSLGEDILKGTLFFECRNCGADFKKEVR